jgi:dienelactone hydrolase
MESTVLTNPSSSGETTGATIKIAGSIETYVAEPKGKTVHKDTAILYLPDVLGIWQNSKLMADQFAANGYYTVMPDLFNGDPLTLSRPEGFDLMKWLVEGSTGDNPHTLEAVEPIVEKSIKFLQKKGFKKIGAVGYCFVSLPRRFINWSIADILNRAPNTLSASC